MIIILFGTPGSGKGTQSEQLKKELGLVHISTGDLFRHHLGENTLLGQEARVYINRGDLVPDEVTINMVRDRLLDLNSANGIIFDGFPRTYLQAEALDNLLQEMDEHIHCVLHIQVSHDEIVRRLSGRMVCGKCQKTFHKEFNPFITCPTDECEGEYLYQRDDDKPETIRARLETYDRQTAPLINYYRHLGLLKVISGEQPIEKVTQDVHDAISG